MKRFFSLFLLFAILTGALSLLSACRSPLSPDNPGGTIDVEFIDHLDDYGDSLDFSEYEEFVISFPEHFYYEVYGEEGSNEKLDTLIFNRNRLLESRFGIRIATEGGIADLTVIDLNRPHNIDSATFKSLGRATPFDGWGVSCDIALTVCGGEVVYENLNTQEEQA